MPDRRPAPLRLGFLAVTESAPLVVAHEQGLFARRGLPVILRREVGWATLRDKVLYGELDAAALPAPLLWAIRLGLGGSAPVAVCTGFVFNQDSSAVTLSRRLSAGGSHDAAGLREQALRRRGAKRLTFGIDLPYSSAHLRLRRWLRGIELDPDRDARIAVVPPAQMAKHLAAGALDGYCASEPWNTVAVQSHDGWCPTRGGAVGPELPGTVLLVRQTLTRQRASEHAALIGALAEAARWCDRLENRAPMAEMLAATDYINVPARVLAPALTGGSSPPPDRPERASDLLAFHAADANAPTLARAAALQEELLAAKLLPDPAPSADLLAELFREDLYRDAIHDPGAYAGERAPPAVAGTEARRQGAAG